MDALLAYDIVHNARYDERYLSLYDTLRNVTGHPNPRKLVKMAQKEYPEDFAALKKIYFGDDVYPTPAADAGTIFVLLCLIPHPKCAAYRKLCIDVLVKVAEGDAKLAEDILRRRCLIRGSVEEKLYLNAVNI